MRHDDLLTAEQRAYLPTLLYRAGYGTGNVTLLHYTLGAPESALGRPVGEWLDGLPREAAARLIERLERELA